MLYVGIDLHRRTSRIVTMDAAGAVISQRTVASDRASVEDAFSHIERPAEAVFEATWGWGWLADLLEEMGVKAHMAHPLQTRAISAARVKNDAIDARTLAHLLRTSMVPESWIAPPEVREARRQVRMRVALGRIRTGVKQQVHALLGGARHPPGARGRLRDEGLEGARDARLARLQPAAARFLPAAHHRAGRRDRAR